MSIQDWLINAICEMKSNNIEPSLITIGRSAFDCLMVDVMKLSTIKAAENENANEFMGVSIEIDEFNINIIKVE